MTQMSDSRLNPRILRIAEALLPSFLLHCLDPVKTLIESEVQWAAMQALPGQIVLDAGAGEGRHKRYFHRGTYLGLDSMVGDPTWNYSKLDVCGSLESLPLRTASVDCVLCMVVLEHTRVPGQALKEFARVLKPGGTLMLVVPLLWEEHQAPHDYFRFTRYGVRALFEPLPFKINLLNPIGGFFWLCARRCVNLLGFFQRGWRWLFFLFLAPLFGVLFPTILYLMDPLDSSKHFTLGYQVRAVREKD
jgi:SAM-dependent methyltransferase